MSAPDEPETPVHPRAHATLLRQGKAGGLSNQFADLLAQAGLREKQPHRKTHGTAGACAVLRVGLSFHCLRHTAVSLLKEAGVPAAVVMELVGHDSPEIYDALYAHRTRALADAAAKFPDSAGEMNLDDWEGNLRSTGRSSSSYKGWNNKQAERYIRDGWASWRDGRLKISRGRRKRPSTHCRFFNSALRRAWRLPYLAIPRLARFHPQGDAPSRRLVATRASVCAN